MYRFQAPPPWYPQAPPQLLPNVHMMHPSQPSPQVEELLVAAAPITKGKKTNGVGRSKLSNFNTQEYVKPCHIIC